MVTWVTFLLPTVSSPAGCHQENGYAKSCSDLICQRTAAQNSRLVWILFWFIPRTTEIFLPTLPTCYKMDFLQFRPIQSSPRADLITSGGKKSLYVIFLEARPAHQRSLWQSPRVPARADCSCTSQRGVWWWIRWQKNLIIQNGEVTCLFFLSAKGAGWTWLTRERVVIAVCLPQLILHCKARKQAAKKIAEQVPGREPSKGLEMYTIAVRSLGFAWTVWKGTSKRDPISPQLIHRVWASFERNL